MGDTELGIGGGDEARAGGAAKIMRMSERAGGASDHDIAAIGIQIRKGTGCGNPAAAIGSIGVVGQGSERHMAGAFAGTGGNAGACRGSRGPRPPGPGEGKKSPFSGT